jgi:hypothetical protein
MPINLLGTVLASPVVTGNYNTDTYGTHYSFLGVGGWQELQTVAERDAIPVDALGNIDPTGLSSGRRRLGMLVYVAETDTVYQLYVPYNVFTGLTNTGRVSALSNNTNWIEFTSSGGGDAIKKKYQQTAHGFTPGNVVSFNGTSYVKGIASAGNTYEFLGIVSSVIDANNFVLTYAGFMDLSVIPGLSANTVYFVSPTVAGGITPIEPTGSGQSSRPILITQESNKGLVMMMRSFIVSDSGGSGSTGNGLRIQRTTTQNSHGFALGDVVRYSGGTYQKALATVAVDDFPLGIVSKVVDTNSFILCFAGYVDGFVAVNDAAGNPIQASKLYYLSPTVAGKLTPTKPTTNGQIVKPIFQTLSTNDGIIVNQRGIAVGGLSGTTTIGPAEDGSYSDGIFKDFTPSTPIGTAVDRFNELLLALSPQPAPQLASVNRTGTAFNSGSLSFGASKNNISYNNVTTNAGNSAVDINGTYVVSGTRLGITNTTSITGVLNSGVSVGSSYPANAFGDADKGKLQLELNGVVIDQLMLSGTTAATTSTRMSVSAALPVTSGAGNPVPLFRYRTGTYTLPNSTFANGFNYIRIRHIHPGVTGTTNYLEWVYDSNANAMALTGSSFTGLTLTGSRYISGVRYNTGGTVVYRAAISNAYRNTFANGTAAFAYPSRINLTDATSIIKQGNFAITETNANKNLPILNSGATSPQLSSLILRSTHTLQNNILGTSSIQVGLTVNHPTKATLTGTPLTSAGFLQYTTVQGNTLNVENFTGEVKRIQARDYSALTYGNINSGTYAWDSTQSLIGGNAFYNTGLLRFNGELMYPNAAYLTSQYGITSGNFAGLTNILSGNPNYSTATGLRSDYTKFTSANAVTQATVTFNILHTGSNSSFLTNGGTGGTPTGNFIKFEFMIKRVGGQTHGWFNPFATTGNGEGVANTSISSIGGGTSVSCTLSTVPRIGNGDVVLVRVIAASGWTNRISNISITNI